MMASHKNIKSESEEEKTMKKYFYFKELTEEREKKLASLDGLTAAQFDEVTKQARAEFAAQDVKIKNGSKTFDASTAFISSCDTLHGFYICGADLRNGATNYKLLLIAFERVRGYDFQKHEPKPERLEPVAIYEDERENLYTIHTATLDTRPLDEWREKLQANADHARSRAELWRKVKRLYKKDGAPFATLSKNFDGVRIIEEYNALKLEASGRTDGGAYISDTLYNCDRYPLKNIDDVIPTINKYIDYLTEYAAEQERTRDIAENIYIDVFGTIYEKILKYQTPTNAGGVKLEHFYFTVRELLEKMRVL